MGLHHDRAWAVGYGLPAFPYAYGWFVSGVGKDIMSYPYNCSGFCPTRTIFSSPLFNFPGTGVPSGTVNDDTARALNGTSNAVANYRQSVCTYSVGPRLREVPERRWIRQRHGDSRGSLLSLDGKFQQRLPADRHDRFERHGKRAWSPMPSPRTRSRDRGPPRSRSAGRPSRSSRPAATTRGTSTVTDDRSWQSTGRRPAAGISSGRARNSRAAPATRGGRAPMCP